MDYNFWRCWRWPCVGCFSRAADGGRRVRAEQYAKSEETPSVFQPRAEGGQPNVHEIVDATVAAQQVRVLRRQGAASRNDTTGSGRTGRLARAAPRRAAPLG